MEIALYTCILPRLEVPYLEEWINHHLQLGVDTIYIYDNGYTIGKIDSTPDALQLVNKSQPDIDIEIQWTKKPNAEYFLNYTDRELQDMVRDIADTYPEHVKFIPWHYDIHRLSHPYSQVSGYKHCIREFGKNKWWLHIDPDEYIILHKNDSFKDLINVDTSIIRLLFKQRVFQKRVPGESVRKIVKWAYDIDLFKSLVYRPVPGKGFRLGIHNIPSASHGRSFEVPSDTGMIYHYRGHPLHGGGRRHLELLNNQKTLHFNKIDDRMCKYL